MASSRKKSKSRKSSKHAVRGGKNVTLGGRKYNCRAKRVKAFGRKSKVAHAYCKRVHKAK